jgi:hypothetical protein
MLKAGYAPTTARSGQQYARIRKHLTEFYSPERIKADILKAEDDFTKDKDNTNRCRMIELRAKVQGLLKEQPVQAVAIFTNIDKDLEQVIVTHDTPSA